MTQQCETTFARELEAVKEVVKGVLSEEAFNLFAERCDSDNYDIVNDQLHSLLRASSTVHLGVIEASWPALGSQRFIDKMRQAISNYIQLNAAVDRWDAFLNAHGGVKMLDWKYNR